MAQKRELPAVVVIAAKGKQWMEACTGSVVRVIAHGSTFENYVLTARHCLVRDKEGPLPLGVTVPQYDDNALALESEVFDTTVAYVSRTNHTSTAGTVVWDDGDWIILRVRTPFRLAVLEAFDGDPKTAIPPGTSRELLSYVDRAFIDLHTHRRGLCAHAHPFHWTGVPEDIEQGGHSGAPVTWNGKLVGMFVGATENSRGCQLLCGKRWPKKLHFVSVAAVREQAAKVGFRF
jgi:hypothetical protein